MKKFVLPSCLMLALMLSSCANLSYSNLDDADMVTQSRPLRGFERVHVNGSPTVYFTQADSFSVRVKGPEDKLGNIITEVNGSTLTVRNKGKVGLINISAGGNHCTVYVTSPDLVGVSVSGSGDFLCDGHVDTDELDVRVTGSGNIEFSDVICDRCNAQVVGSGDLEIMHLDTRQTSGTVVGSGDLKIKQVNSANTDLEVRGSGDIKVDFLSGCGAVKAEILGSGDITLKGKVRKFNMKKRGSGDIDTDDLRVE